MKHLGFEHNGEYADIFKHFPILEHETSNKNCQITVCNSGKSLGTDIYFELKPDNYQMIIKFKAKPKNIIFYIDIVEISKHTKQSIENLIDKVKENYKKEHY